MKDLKHYATLAEMFRYPTAEMGNYSTEWSKIVCGYDNSLMHKLDPFLAHISEKPLTARQEYYTATFDVQAVCCLDAGYVLFGEDFKRGIFLVNIKEEQAKVHNNCGSELPDHLTNILTLLPKIRNAELAEELVFSMLVPALHEMISGFKETANVYKGLLEIVAGIMEADYPSSAYERFKIIKRIPSAGDKRMSSRVQTSNEYFSR